MRRTAVAREISYRSIHGVTSWHF